MNSIMCIDHAWEPHTCKITKSRHDLNKATKKKKVKQGARHVGEKHWGKRREDHRE